MPGTSRALKKATGRAINITDVQRAYKINSAMARLAQVRKARVMGKMTASQFKEAQEALLKMAEEH